MEFILTPDTLHWPSLSAGSNGVRPLAPPQTYVSLYDSALGPAIQPSIGLNCSYPVIRPCGIVPRGGENWRWAEENPPHRRQPRQFRGWHRDLRPIAISPVVIPRGIEHRFTQCGCPE